MSRSPPWMLSKTSFSGHGKLGIQHSFQLPPLPCGIINSDSSRDGFQKVRSFSVKVKSPESLIPHPLIDPREAIGHCAQILTSTQIFDGNYPSSATGGVSVLRLQFPPSWSTFCPTTNDHYFFSRVQAPLPPRKAHHTHSLHRQFLLRSQELKFLCYRRIRRQVHWRPCSRRHSQLLHLQLLARDGITRVTTALLLCTFPHYLWSPLHSPDSSKRY